MRPFVYRGMNFKYRVIDDYSLMNLLIKCWLVLSWLNVPSASLKTREGGSGESGSLLSKGDISDWRKAFSEFAEKAALINLLIGVNEIC